jgi:CPA1 family monovalent cation:H+ antiporter
LGDLEYLFALLLAAVLLVRAADLVHLPYPIVLVLGGLVVAAIPGLPSLELEPDAILLVFLPPLLMSAGWYASPRELRAESRALGALALVLVLVTMVAVAVVAHALVDGLPWAAAFVLGAVVAPTDAVAAIATFSRVSVPERVSRLVQGESLINDATGLTAFKVAVTAAVAGTFAPGHALLDFVWAAAGGAAVGLVIGRVGVSLLRKLNDVSVVVVITVLVAYSAYIVAERIDASGVLACVACGLYTGWHQAEYFDADTRLTASAFWRILVFALETLLFVLLGVQFDTVVHELEGRSAAELIGAGLAVSAAVIAVRAAFALLPLSDELTRRERIVVGWCGMRGAISLGAALGAPLAMPGRPEVIVLTYAVILVTLVGQGLTLPWVIRALKLEAGTEWSLEEAIARLETAQAALDRLDEVEAEGEADPEQLRRLRELYRRRFQTCMAIVGGERGRDALDEARERREKLTTLRRDVMDTERSALLRLRDEGRVGQETVRHVERDLDLDEARLT